MINTIAIVTGVVGIVGVIGSLIFSGWQASLLARQTRVQNTLAYTEANQEAANRLNATYRVFIDFPELRQYFYDGRPCPVDEADRARVMTIAEMLGDVVGAMLFTATEIGVAAQKDPWVDYGSHLLDCSPTLAGMVRDHPRWWPELYQMLAKKDADASSTKCEDLEP